MRFRATTVASWFATHLAFGAMGVVTACGAANGSTFDDLPVFHAEVDASEPGTNLVVGPYTDGGLNLGDGAIANVDASQAPPRTLATLTISPEAVALDVKPGSAAMLPFTAVAHFDDGSTEALTSGVSWRVTNVPVGNIGAGGTYTANGSRGGAVTVTAELQGKTASAALDVVYSARQRAAGLADAAVTALAEALAKAPAVPSDAPPTGAADADVAWLYPYDRTVFPRGLPSPKLMWNVTSKAGAEARDEEVYGFALTSATSNIEVYANGLTTGGAGKFTFDAAAWNTFVDSNAGAVTLKIARFSEGKAKIVKLQPYVIAPQEMLGTIYYWSIASGSIQRIRLGDAARDDFFQGLKDDWKGNQDEAVQCPACHTVSAKGSRLVMSTGRWDVDSDEHSRSYDLVKNKTDFLGASVRGNHAGAYALAAVSPNGNVIVENAAPLRGSNLDYETGAFDATSMTAAKIPNTGLEGKRLWMPAFSPDGKELAYVADGTTAGTRDLRVFDWDVAQNAATGDRHLIGAGSDPKSNVIGFPSLSPDHGAIIFQRSAQLGSLNAASNAANGFSPPNPGNLYIANVAPDGTATETRLRALNGDSYPFAAGERDRNLNYEPTFAPVAAGGYYWVVFHSRRTYGNELTGDAFEREGRGVKQLWVAAIDPKAPPGTDPSHAAFWLPGQDVSTLNMRGYWALDPCKGDGLGCASGTECCGGYCSAGAAEGGVRPKPDAGAASAATCRSTQATQCANMGDHCDSAAECCGAASNGASGTNSAQCVNNVCSVPATPPVVVRTR